ncbi:hypothetical protein GA0070607_0073 [Micromonospora coriariae]|uniref:Uncharacterized protein n=1 Tax=Micromonospora coriariae TaxID=285665 RepID=A0A1C4U315_9ACTN|nr:hypothetical protein GA0070607_0073 [Micromonospora coriariae]
MLSVRLLGDLEIVVDGRAVDLSGIKAQTLILIAASGPAGITSSDLERAMEGVGRGAEKGTLHRRVTEVRKALNNQVSPYKDDQCYRLKSTSRVTVDSWEFSDGVALLAAGAPDPAEADRLMGLWRGNPLPRRYSPAWPVWRAVAEGHDRLVALLDGWERDRLAELTALRRYASLFPDDWKLQKLRGALSGKPQLLVVEDQVMDEIVLLLKDEFEIVQAASYRDFDALRESGALNTVRAALVDKHLESESDSYGTTKVATYLQRHTEIPVTLMSVDVEYSSNKQFEMCLKYRLSDVVRKHHNGGINSGIVDAVRAMVDDSPRGWSLRMRRWVESVAFTVQDESLMGQDNSNVMDCLAARDRVVALLERGPLEQAEDAVEGFRRRWDPSAGAARR